MSLTRCYQRVGADFSIRKLIMDMIPIHNTISARTNPEAVTYAFNKNDKSNSIWQRGVKKDGLLILLFALRHGTCMVLIKWPSREMGQAHLLGS